MDEQSDTQRTKTTIDVNITENEKDSAAEEKRDINGLVREELGLNQQCGSERSSHSSSEIAPTKGSGVRPLFWRTYCYAWILVLIVFIIGTSLLVYNTFFYPSPTSEVKNTAIPSTNLSLISPSPTLTSTPSFTSKPSFNPTISHEPSRSSKPSIKPSISNAPSLTSQPSMKPSDNPSEQPSRKYLESLTKNPFT